MSVRVRVDSTYVKRKRGENMPNLGATEKISLLTGRLYWLFGGETSA
jgi:hypothetical protein